jgi:hypothetical protein
MRSLNHFIVEPKSGQRYNNTRDISGVEVNISASNEDHSVTNRIGVVGKIPINYNGPINDGDEVIVHHNTFRLTKDTKGIERSSWGHLFGDNFMVDKGDVYAYRSVSGTWKAISPYCFIEPIKSLEGSLPDTIDFNLSEVQLFGVMVYPNEDQSHISPGELVGFIPESEYEFNIEGKRLYRMKTNMICLVSEKRS